MNTTVRALRRDRYREFLTSQGLRFHFDVEIAALSDKVTKGTANDIPPVELWHAIIPAARVAEKLRERFGATTILSAYRSKAYNVAVYHPKQATDSQHSKNTALDVKCATGTPAEWAAHLRELRGRGVFTGGIGTYKTFVHVDTRGSVADWGG